MISTDKIRFLLADDEKDQTIHREVFATVRYLIRRRLQSRRPLTILDATNLTRNERRAYIKLAQIYDACVEAVFFNVPVEVCKIRNQGRDRVVPEEAIDLMAQKLVEPTVAEGFDSVLLYSAPSCV